MHDVPHCHYTTIATMSLYNPTFVILFSAQESRNFGVLLMTVQVAIQYFN